jgi:biofilm PGA synthesis N-glycosyltransferase PgaC
METAHHRPRYIVISPVKDEEPYVERTLQCMVDQTLRPVLLVIVDDGSNDRTPEILSRYEKDHDFIRVIRTPATGSRQPGSAVIRAFNAGYDSVGNVDYDFVVKLDCDLSFSADYFEALLACFANDDRLGIASGVYLESPDGSRWIEIEMPAYHAAGASKVIRKECFEQIGGFVASRGWDTLDEIRAIARGWRTTHFRDLKMKHWKIEGSGIGQWRTNLMHGEIYFLSGGGPLFFLLKVVHRMTRRPYVVGAIALLWGYLRAMVKRKPLLVTDEEGRCYRALLNGRIANKLNALRPSHTA